MKTTEALSGAAHNAAALGNLSVASAPAPAIASTFDATTRLIRQNPWYAAGAALGIGVLLTLLIPKS